MPHPLQNLDFRVDRKNLYRDESITDMKVASIRKLTPITEDGSEDTSRKTVFMGMTQLMSPQGPLPVQCEINAKTMTEAIDKFPEAIGRTLDQMMEEAQKMQRKEASRIIVPGIK